MVNKATLTACLLLVLLAMAFGESPWIACTTSPRQQATMANKAILTACLLLVLLAMAFSASDHQDTESFSRLAPSLRRTAITTTSPREPATMANKAFLTACLLLVLSAMAFGDIAEISVLH
ncbi:hypothetical protein MUK42_28613 [Musa troglodytarum]|uniref:Uncharacterized protein n=1 Tax=Musa troglodytarum TaxID=320322 RepID=A0A9E7FMQ5_9LILI|nr:hypothetical protein MUK42_28613 [Musa troglodytarum]